LKKEFQNLALAYFTFTADGPKINSSSLVAASAHTSGTRIKTMQAVAKWQLKSFQEGESCQGFFHFRFISATADESLCL
jgi:hypothetical protein